MYHTTFYCFFVCAVNTWLGSWIKLLFIKCMVYTTLEYYIAVKINLTFNNIYLNIILSDKSDFRKNYMEAVSFYKFKN